MSNSGILTDIARDHTKVEFLGKDDTTLPARSGDVLICDISEPHGVRAKGDLRVLVTIAPPI